MQEGPPRKTEWQPWPVETRPHYISLFLFQEHMRAHLKLAQELAVQNYRLKYGGNPRKTNPMRIVGRQDDHLKEYQAEQLPKVRRNLTRMQNEIDGIKSAFTSTKHPKWYKQTLEVEKLTGRIWKKMNAIEVNLILTESYPIKKSNESIIEETRQALEIAWDIRKKLLFFRPDQIAFGLDDFGIYEIIIDLAEQPEPEPESEEQYSIDLTTTTLWQQDHKKKHG